MAAISIVSRAISLIVEGRERAMIDLLDVSRVLWIESDPRGSHWSISVRRSSPIVCTLFLFAWMIVVASAAYRNVRQAKDDNDILVESFRTMRRIAQGISSYFKDVWSSPSDVRLHDPLDGKATFDQRSSGIECLSAFCRLLSTKEKKEREREELTS